MQKQTPSDADHCNSKHYPVQIATAAAGTTWQVAAATADANR